jgi:hypothetical protein
LHTQLPAVHIAVVGQTWPHVPQLVGDDCRFAHAVRQSVSPAVGQTHVPASQTANDAHVWLHVPQCRVLVIVSTQRGAAPIAVQSVRPLVAPHSVHSPPAHVPP